MWIEESGKLDYNTYRINKYDLCKYFFKSFLFCILVSYTFYKSIIIAIISIPISIVYPFFIKNKLRDNRKKKLLLEFKDMVNILVSYLDAGYSIENAFLKIPKEIKKIYPHSSMIEEELKIINNYIMMNKPIEEPLRDFAFRSGIEDIIDFAEVFILAKKSGGELHKIIDNTLKTLRDKIQIEMDIESKTTEKKFEQTIMNLIPFFIIIYMNISSRDFLIPMYTTLIGRVIMTICLIAYGFSYYMAQKILNIEV